VAAKFFPEGKDLSRPAAKLLEAVRGAIAVTYRPAGRKGDVESDAGQARDKPEPARERALRLQLRRQWNIEVISDQAAALLPQTVSEDPIGYEWICDFFEQCQDVTNQEMRSLWAKLLAGEVSQPGTYSRRTLHVVKRLRAPDVQLFARLCSCTWIGPNEPVVVLYGPQPPHPEARWPITPDQLVHLERLGLLRFDPRAGFAMRVPVNVLRYFDRPFAIDSPNDQGMLLGPVLLTSVGRELAAISGARADYEYMKRTVEHWRSAGFGVTDLLSQATPSA
jgi:hypothetical protein